MIHVSAIAHIAAREREQHVTLHGDGGSLVGLRKVSSCVVAVMMKQTFES